MDKSSPLFCTALFRALFETNWRRRQKNGRKKYNETKHKLDSLALTRTYLVSRKLRNVLVCIASHAFVFDVCLLEKLSLIRITLFRWNFLSWKLYDVIDSTREENFRQQNFRLLSFFQHFFLIRKKIAIKMFSLSLLKFLFRWKVSWKHWDCLGRNERKRNSR